MAAATESKIMKSPKPGAEVERLLFWARWAGLVAFPIRKYRRGTEEK